jgi:hypothetical protein
MRSCTPIRRTNQSLYFVGNDKFCKESIRQNKQPSPHQGSDGGPPFPAAKPEPMTGASRLVLIPVVGGLHHRYVRMAA